MEAKSLGGGRQGRSDAAAGPKDYVCVGAAGGGHGFVLERDRLLLGHFFNARDHFGVIATSMCQGRTIADFDVTMLSLADGGIVGGVGYIDDQRDIRF